MIYAEGRKETNYGKAGEKKQNEEKMFKQKNMHIVKIKHRTNRQKNKQHHSSKIYGKQIEDSKLPWSKNFLTIASLKMNKTMTMAIINVIATSFQAFIIVDKQIFRSEQISDTVRDGATRKNSVARRHSHWGSFDPAMGSKWPPRRELSIHWRETFSPETLSGEKGGFKVRKSGWNPFTRFSCHLDFIHLFILPYLLYIFF